MKELVKQLNEAAKAYYSEGKSLMTDKEYDRLYDELVKMEKETGTVLPDSPTRRVGFKVVSGLAKTVHESPALSLDKTKDRDALKKWLGDKEGILSWKMDGLTIVATYDNGKLVRGATRGDGYTGEDVTHNAPYIKGLPAEIPYMEHLVVRGEAVISYADFGRINDEITDPDEKYKNPRNLASSSVRLLDSYKASERKLHFKAFTLVTPTVETVKQSYQLLQGYGFDVVDYRKVDAGNILDAVQAFEHDVESMSEVLAMFGGSDNNYPTDGLVLAYNDIPYGMGLGTTGKFPRHSIAFKWHDDSVETVLRNVEWSASRTGLINPVAVFDPVELEGTTVTRASIHNIAYLENLKLGYGDTVTVYKANKIIPQLEYNLTKNGNLIRIPSVCPVCGQPTERRISKDGDSEFLYCTNPECSAKHIGKFARLAERDGLNIVGLAKSQLECFTGRGYITQFRDLFHLSDYRDEIIELDGFGEKSFSRLVTAIEDSRHTTFRQAFYAFGIPGAGHDVAKTLEKNLASPKMESLFKLMKSDDPEEIMKDWNGIGEITAQTMKEWFDRHSEEAELLCMELDISDPEPDSKADNSLAGKVFVITGSLETYPNRNALKDEIESRGGKVSGGVSKSTTYLINNDTESTSGKNKKAKELGIPVISEAQYKEL